MKMENNKRRLVTCDVEDIISNLPEHLLDSIVERLPLQDAVRASILSKKWRYKWTKMTKVVLSEQFFKKFGKNGAFGPNGFMRIINHIMILHDGPILKFILHIPDLFLDSFQEIDQWMHILSKNGVRELVLLNSNRRYRLPSYVFSCLELRILKLSNCIFNPPPEFQGFIYLGRLFLKNIDFGANFFGTVIILPQLKILGLDRCINTCNFNVKVPLLRKLVVLNCLNAMLLPLLQSQCLIDFCIHLQMPIEGFAPEKILNFSRMLSYLHNIEILNTDGYFLKTLSKESNLSLLPDLFTRLKHWKIQSFKYGDLDQLCGALSLLRKSSNLKTLSVQPKRMGSQAIHVDMEPASNYLESPGCLDKALDRLKTINIVFEEGSRPELLFIKILLDNSPSLKKMIIRPRTMDDPRKMLKIARNIMHFPRASTKAKMLYLDPKTSTDIFK